MDDRDKMIRQKLFSVRDNSEEIKKLQEDAKAALSTSRVSRLKTKLRHEELSDQRAVPKENCERVHSSTESSLLGTASQDEATPTQCVKMEKDGEPISLADRVRRVSDADNGSKIGDKHSKVAWQELVLKAARVEVSAKLNNMKKEMSTKLDEKLRESRGWVENELTLALEELEAQKQETLRSLDTQIDAINEDIIRKVLPFEI